MGTKDFYLAICFDFLVLSVLQPESQNVKFHLDCLFLSSVPPESETNGSETALCLSVR